MQVIKPVTFQQGNLISTNATNAYADWVAGTNYAKDTFVTYGISTYQSLQASNTGKQPDTNPAWWVLIGPSNKYAMFDNQVSTSTTRVNNLTIKLDPGTGITSLALINVVTDTVKCTVRSTTGGPIIYEQTAGVASQESTSWFTYFFNDPLVERTQVLFLDIPFASDCEVTLEFVSNGTISVAVCSYGTLYELGTTQYGARASIIDYSRKDTDSFGTTTFVKRAFSKRLECQFLVSNADINRVQSTLYQMRAEPAIWIGSSEPSYAESLVVFGFYRDISTEISYPSFAQMSLTIEGLS